MDILIVVGTRPEVVKMAPVIRAFEKQGQPFILVHSGQHYDYNLSLQFIEELGLPKPDYSLKVRERSPAAQTGRMMITVEGVVKKEKPRFTFGYSPRALFLKFIDDILFHIIHFCHYSS